MSAIRSLAGALVHPALHAHSTRPTHVHTLARHNQLPELPRSRWFGEQSYELPSQLPVGANAALGTGSLALLGAQISRLKPAATPAAVEPTGKPQIGDYGFDEAGMDRSAKPGDDFNRYASGTAIDAIKIPDDLGSYGAFIKLRQQSNERVKGIVESLVNGKAAAGTDDRKVADLYHSFMDTKTIEARGIEPLKPELAKIDSIKTSSDVARVMGELSRSGGTTLFGLLIGPDSKNPERYIAQLNQGGLGLPDRDYYFNTDQHAAELRDKYKKHIANMLKLAGVADADAKAEKIFALETAIANVHWNNVDSRDADKTYNIWSRADFDSNAPGVDWKTYLDAVGVGDQSKLIVAQPSAFTGMAKLMSSVPPDTWKDYLTFHAIKEAAPLLSKAFVDEDFDFSGRALQGLKQQGERWKRGVGLVTNSMSDAIGKHYVAEYFPPETKARCEQLVKNVIAAMDARLTKVDWMEPQTRAKAREKLAAFTAMLGYPDSWRDYGTIDVQDGKLYESAQSAAAYEYTRNLKKLGQPVDRREWFMTPMTVNAYADPGTNSIVFPAAILQPPFFDPNADDAVNYGAIGAVIGHEISHHFDDQGRKFDKDGKLTDWWTAQDVKNFTDRTAKVVAQYNAFEPIKGTHVNGELTLGENMADLAGINVAYDAYTMSLGGKEAPVINGFSGAQRFFLGFAQVWRTKYRDETLRTLLSTDPHSPGMVRAGIVRNIDAWYDAFGVKPGDAMYLAPDQRLRVW